MRIFLSVWLLLLAVSSYGLKLTSTAFHNNEFIPKQYTCEGNNQIPTLTWNHWPAATQSFVFIISDSDAAGGTWYHWLVYNIPVSTNVLNSTNAEKFPMVKNSWGHQRYDGPCPPDKLHHYLFKLYALDTMLDLPATADPKMLEKALVGHVLATAEFLGLYLKSTN